MLPSDIRENREGLSSHTGSKMLNKENVCPSQSGKSELVTVDTGKAEIGDFASLLNLTLVL